jgi:hypothetical protein
VATLYSTRVEFSARAHIAALTQVYERIAPGAQLVSCVGTDWDHHHGVDYVMLREALGMGAPLPTPLQERWRGIEFAHFASITITAWDVLRGQPAELHKMLAHWFVSGFYDDRADRIVGWSVVNVPTMIDALVAGRLRYSTQSRGDGEMSFLAITLADLRDIGAVLYESQEGN